MRADAHRVSRFAKHSDVAGIAAKSRNVLLHPRQRGQRGELVKQAEVGQTGTQVEESVDANAVVDGHADHAVAREPTAVVHGRCTRAMLESTASDPDHHRLRGRPQTGRPDVEVQAILSSGGMFRDQLIAGREIRHLGRLRAEGERVADAAPCFDRLGRPEPQVAKGWRSVRDALEGMHAIGRGATHLAATGLDDSVHLHDPQRCATSKDRVGHRLSHTQKASD